MSMQPLVIDSFRQATCPRSRARGQSGGWCAGSFWSWAEPLGLCL